MYPQCRQQNFGCSPQRLKYAQRDTPDTPDDCLLRIQLIQGHFGYENILTQRLVGRCFSDARLTSLSCTEVKKCGVRIRSVFLSQLFCTCGTPVNAKPCTPHAMRLVRFCPSQGNTSSEVRRYPRLGIVSRKPHLRDTIKSCLVNVVLDFLGDPRKMLIFCQKTRN